MLELINQARTAVGASPVVLGDNNAAQFHAEVSLEHCVSSHWGIDGTKPYMRYSLAGGYQNNSENASGIDYCINSFDGFSAIDPERETQKAIDSWLGSPGHRKTIERSSFRKANIGLAWDRFNFKAVLQLETDFVEYRVLPTIDNGILTLSGIAKNGIGFNSLRDLSGSVFFDPPLQQLTVGQIARAYSTDVGLRVAALRRPGRYSADAYTRIWDPCLSPYDVPVEAPPPNSVAESRRLHAEAREACETLRMSQGRNEITVAWITASKWTAAGNRFAITADLSSVLQRHGDGIYTIVVWGALNGGEKVIISEYSIFHGVTPPSTYAWNPTS